jgi:sulfur-oxidizing protein SoxZ
MVARTVLTLPVRVKAAEAFEVRALLQHAMESGHRLDPQGKPLARSIVRRFEARFEGDLVCAVDLHPAIAANPYLAFWLRIERAGNLQLLWVGDDGFEHREQRRIELA